MTLRASLDYEKVKNYHFMVMAYDSGIPPLSSFTKVSVIVEDVNDNAPFMLQEQYQLDVYENRTVGDELMQVGLCGTILRCPLFIYWTKIGHNSLEANYNFIIFIIFLRYLLWIKTLA